MPLISIVMPCYNAAAFLEQSVNSVITQSLIDWELIIVDDGSTDSSGKIAKRLEAKDRRIRSVYKSNGGVASARNYGYKEINPLSEYLIFYDADDLMHPDMLMILHNEIKNNPRLGAVYCDYVFIDESNNLTGKLKMPRYIPTQFWVEKERDENTITKFISVFCWTQMFESLTLIRKAAYAETSGWNEGLGNIGEGVDLFSEIAFRWQVAFVNRELYFYRRYERQVTNVENEIILKQSEKIVSLWKSKVWTELEKEKTVKAAILFCEHRLKAYLKTGSFRHQLRYDPIKFLATSIQFLYHYLYSLKLVWLYRLLLKSS